MSWEPLFDALTNRYPRAEIEHLPGAISEVHLLDEAGAEYRALTQTCAVVVTPLMLPVVIEGRDAVDYLHRRTSQDIKAIGDGDGAWVLQLDGAGRIELEILLYRCGWAFWGLIDRHDAERGVELIEKYVFNETITVHKQWHAEGVVALAGPLATVALASLLPARPAWLESSWGASALVELRGPSGRNVACRIFRDGRWPVPYYHLMAPLPALPDLVALLEAIAEGLGGGVAGARAHEYFRIEQGVPRMGHDIGESVIPLEAGMNDAVSFEKGCYPGQEVLARMRNLGHPARLLAGLRWPAGTPVHAGADLVYSSGGGEIAGTVTSVAALPGEDAVLGLGYVKWARRNAESLGAIVKGPGGGDVVATQMRVLHCPESGANPCAPETGA